MGLAVHITWRSHVYFGGGGASRLSPFTLFLSAVHVIFLVAIITNNRPFKEEEQLRGRCRVLAYVNYM
jgi:hypothetical protein